MLYRFSQTKAKVAIQGQEIENLTMFLEHHRPMQIHKGRKLEHRTLVVARFRPIPN